MRKKRTTPVRINRAIDTGKSRRARTTVYELAKTNDAESNPHGEELATCIRSENNHSGQNNHHGVTPLFRTASLQHGEPNVREPSPRISGPEIQ